MFSWDGGADCFKSKCATQVKQWMGQDEFVTILSHAILNGTNVSARKLLCAAKFSVNKYLAIFLPVRLAFHAYISELWC